MLAAAAFGLLVAAPPRAAPTRATVPRCFEVAAADALSQSPALLATAGTAIAAIGGILINNQQKKKPAAVPAEVAEVAPPAPKPSPKTTAYRGKVPALCCRRSTPSLCIAAARPSCALPPPPPQHQPVRTLPSLPAGDCRLPPRRRPDAAHARPRAVGAAAGLGAALRCQAARRRFVVRQRRAAVRRRGRGRVAMDGAALWWRCRVGELRIGRPVEAEMMARVGNRDVCVGSGCVSAPWHWAGVPQQSHVIVMCGPAEHCLFVSL